MDVRSNWSATLQTLGLSAEQILKLRRWVPQEDFHGVVLLAIELGWLPAAHRAVAPESNHADGGNHAEAKFRGAILQEAITQMPADGIREICRKLSLCTKGNKPTLITRLCQLDQNRLWEEYVRRMHAMGISMPQFVDLALRAEGRASVPFVPIAVSSATAGRASDPLVPMAVSSAMPQH